MFYAVACLEIQIPESRSLKEKRGVVKRLLARVSQRFGCSTAEVGFQDLHQRAALGVALIVSGPAAGANALEAIRREVEQDPRIVVLEYRKQVAALEDQDLGYSGPGLWEDRS